MKTKRIICTAVSTTLALSFVFGCAAGCRKSHGDPERDPLVMGISQPDGVFNPFFSTSAYDSTIIGMTQIGMLSTDKDGGIVPRVLTDDAGNVTGYVTADNDPCVVEYWDSKFEVSDEGQSEYPNVETETKTNGVTTYQLAIKKGIKFSDGTDLTMKDVLFNLYTYLDPAYTGSSTVYSTHILGLSAYRTQNPKADSKGMSAFEENAQAAAKNRKDELVDFVNCFGSNSTSLEHEEDRWAEKEENDLLEEYMSVATEFKKELENYWGTAVDSVEGYKDWNDGAGVGDAWVVYLLDYGGYTDLIERRQDNPNAYRKDDAGNCYIDGTVKQEMYGDLVDYCEEHVDEKGNAKPLDPATEEGQKAYCVDKVFSSYFPGFNPESDEEAWVRSGIKRADYKKINEVLYYWTTGDTIGSRYAAEFKRDIFASSGGRAVPNISGITVLSADNIFGHALGDTYDILQVKIRGVDPKAIWNLAFTVAPYKYYSGKYTPENATAEKDYVKALDEADIYSATNAEFGVELGDFDFFQNVVNAPEKVGIPVGAGPYMAVDRNGEVTRSRSAFFDGSRVYYARNPYYETVAKNIGNAKIKYLQYSVVPSDQIVSMLATGDILYGEPGATTDNIKQLDKEKVAHAEVDTAGYGYVGINPRYVPEVNIRRAIIKAMNTDLIFRNYYQGNLAEPLYRPMTTQNWAYPTGVGVYKSAGASGGGIGEADVTYDYDGSGSEIIELIEAAGYVGSAENGWSKQTAAGVDTLKYTFTIAGGSTDHPAYNMFINAAEVLNRCGFQIKVVQSQTALSDLTTGKLTVWAAAWSSTVDPDMYQVYHKDSKASSVNNWGYPQILNNREAYSGEFDIITELSNLIDKGRESDNQEERKPIYAEALDLVMELAVEFPIYQRKDMYAYNGKIIDKNSLTPEAELGAYNGLFSRIWEVNYK